MEFFIPFPGKNKKKVFLLLCGFLSLIIALSLESQTFSQGSDIRANQIKVLETVNSFRGQWCCANNGYLYGVGANYTDVVRKHETGQSYETRGNVTSLDPSFRIEYKMFPTSKPGLFFILVKNDSGFFLLKSTDGGATFTNVYTFGEDNGVKGSNPEVRILRGLLEITRETPGGGSAGTLYLGEYNISRSRIRGSVNDRVRIMKSIDNGDTWTKVTQWNTNGANQVGHVHAMRQDPYTGEIYICTGDNNDKSGLIKWDGNADWPDNKTLAEISVMDGFTVLYGRQRYRVCDVLFDEDHFYTFADTQLPNNPTGSESGIWKGTKDFSSYTRVNNKIFDFDPMHIGWFGEKIGNTFVFTTAREYVGSFPWKEHNTQVYTSIDGENWYVSGVLNWRDLNNPTLPRYINNVFTYNNKLYIDCIAGAGHYSVIQCNVSKEWKSNEDPVILHPVYYVGTWNTPGNDANSGTSPDVPKRTLNNALTSNRICAGARVKVSEGNFHETNINLNWSNTGLQGRGSVVIEGRGMNETHIISSSGSEDTYGIYIEPEKTLTNSTTPLILKDLDIFSTVGASLNYVLYINGSYIKTIDCIIGNEDNDDSPLVILNSYGSKYLSENSIHIANTGTSIYKEIVRFAASNTSCHLNNCIILNAFNAFEINYPGTDFSLKNCNLYGIENVGVRLGQSCNIEPFIKNSIFSCSYTPIMNLTGLTGTGVDYNLYNKELLNINAGGHSLPVGTDPMHVDAENGDFNLRINSPCIGRGVSLTDLLYDFTNRLRKNPPCLGPFENLLVTRTRYNLANSQSIKIYPNPVSGILTIDYIDEKYSTLSILNSKGIILDNINVNAPVQQLDFSKYSHGLYILQFIKPTGEVSRVKISH